MTELDARLSALLDGELAPDEAAALRDEVERRPELAARLAELAAVDEGLRALPARPLPAELRAQLEARIRAEAGATSLEPHTLPRSAQSGRRAPPRAEHREAGRSPARRWLAAAALAAAAAALALVLLPRLRDFGGPGAERMARTEPAQAPELAPGGSPASRSVPEVVEEPRVEIAERPPVPVPTPASRPAPEAEEIPHDLLDPSDEPAAADVALAEDLPVIEVLDVLAELDELERVGSG